LKVETKTQEKKEEPKGETQEQKEEPKVEVRGAAAEAGGDDA